MDGKQVEKAVEKARRQRSRVDIAALGGKPPGGPGEEARESQGDAVPAPLRREVGYKPKKLDEDGIGSPLPSIAELWMKPHMPPKPSPLDFLL